MTTTQYLYSPTTRGFYVEAIHGPSMPPDAVHPVTAAERAALAEGERAGLLIQPDATGRPVLVQPPPPPEAVLLAALTRDLQAHLDAVAQAYGYDNIYTAVSYADEPAVPKFQLEGQAFRAWRSLFWDSANAIRAAVEAGSRPVPSLAELLAELPAFTPPE